jgi:predicted lipoprotein with Yx(FWY)xxD motif
MRLLAAMTALVALALLVPFAAPADAAGERGTLVAKQSRYGRVLFDRRGFVLYGFTADRPNSSRCNGACAAAWPPLIVKRRPSAGAGTSERLLGVVRRRDGRLQATYDGKPLYYYVGDRRPGQILCQAVNEFGGDWLVVRPSGAYVR